MRPNSAWAYFNRGLLHLGQQDYPRARADFNHFLELRPQVAEAFVNRALARIGLQDYKGAVEDLTRALEDGVKQTRVYFLRSRARAQLKEAIGSREDFREGLRQVPPDEEDWIARGVAKAPSDPTAALGDFEKALELNPRSRRGLQNKASILSENLGRSEDSLPVFDQLVAFSPDQVRFRSGRGIVLARLGRREAAHQDAKHALASDRKPETLYQVAGIYALTARQHPEDRAEALRLLATALRQGYGFDLLEKDTDLDPIRSRAEFRSLVDAARTLRTRPLP
jgi:tetratricopeptide (TPR) repeat protein